MEQVPDPEDVAAALRVSIGLFVRRLRQAPVQGELTLPEISALTRLDRAGAATPGELAKAEQISPQAMGRHSARLSSGAWWSGTRTRGTAGAPSCR